MAIFVLVICATIPTYVPACCGRRVKGNKKQLRYISLTIVFIITTEKVNLFHLALRVFIAEVSIQLDDLRIPVTQPFPDLTVGGSPEKTLAAKKMSEGMKRSMFEPDVTSHSGNFF